MNTPVSALAVTLVEAGGHPAVGAAPAWLAPLAAGAAVVLGVIVIGWQVWLAHRGRRASGGRGLPQTRRADPVVEDFTRDAREVVDRLAALLDAKADRLEHLLAEADRRMRSLEAGHEPARRAEFNAGASRAMRPQGARAVEEPPVALGELQQRILQLAERGIRPIEIARQLQQPVGQVELVIALNRGTLRI